MADILDTAVNAGSFKTLVTVMKAAGLVDALKPGLLTVFAPNDDAFGKLPAGTIDALLQDMPQLTQILRYHIVAGKLMAADIVKLDVITTVEGFKLKIDPSEGYIKVNNAKVTQPDLVADNGVIHGIDTVMLLE